MTKRLLVGVLCCLIFSGCASVAGKRTNTQTHKAMQNVGIDWWNF